MSLPNALAAYEDCFGVFEAAAASTKGSRVLLESETQAKYFRLRMYQARALMRAESKRIYDPEDPRYGKCEYDNLHCRVVPAVAPDEGKAWLYIEPRALQILAVEEIEETNVDLA
jgi:hypothetical protein